MTARVPGVHRAPTVAEVRAMLDGPDPVSDGAVLTPADLARRRMSVNSRELEIRAALAELDAEARRWSYRAGAQADLDAVLVRGELP